MKRLLIVSVFILASTLGATATVSAQGEHRSCADFGQLSAELAPGGGLGELVSQLTTTAGPRAVAAVGAGEHESLCEPAP